MNMHCHAEMLTVFAWCQQQLTDDAIYIITQSAAAAAASRRLRIAAQCMACVFLTPPHTLTHSLTHMAKQQSTILHSVIITFVTSDKPSPRQRSATACAARFAHGVGQSFSGAYGRRVERETRSAQNCGCAQGAEKQTE